MERLTFSFIENMTKTTNDTMKDPTITTGGIFLVLPPSKKKKEKKENKLNENETQISNLDEKEKESGYH